jgi:hypothetical protein
VSFQEGLLQFCDVEIYLDVGGKDPKQEGAIFFNRSCLFDCMIVGRYNRVSRSIDLESQVTSYLFRKPAFSVMKIKFSDRLSGILNQATVNGEQEESR